MERRCRADAYPWGLFGAGYFGYIGGAGSATGAAPAAGRFADPCRGARSPAKTIWQPWLVFFLRSLAEQIRRLEKKIERERLVLASLPELSLQIVEFAREHGRVTIGDVIKLTSASRNTLKAHFCNLVECGHLSQQGRGRGVWYALR